MGWCMKFFDCHTHFELFTPFSLVLLGFIVYMDEGGGGGHCIGHIGPS